MLRGLTTVSFWAADLVAAKQWYAELLGIERYFQRPGYAEFRLGDYQHELGLIDSRYAPDPSATGPAGAIVYWHVDDLRATLEKLAGYRSARAPGSHRPRRVVHHCFGGRSVWEPPGHHVQSALPAGSGRDQNSVSGATGYERLYWPHIQVKGMNDEPPIRSS